MVLGKVVLVAKGASGALGAVLGLADYRGSLPTPSPIDASYCFNPQGLDGQSLQIPERLLEHIY